MLDIMIKRRKTVKESVLELANHLKQPHLTKIIAKGLNSTTEKGYSLGTSCDSVFEIQEKNEEFEPSNELTIRTFKRALYATKQK